MAAAPVGVGDGTGRGRGGDGRGPGNVAISIYSRFLCWFFSTVERNLVKELSVSAPVLGNRSTLNSALT